MATASGSPHKNSNDYQSVLELDDLDEVYEHVFQDPKKCHYYLGLYDQSGYECRHLVDPELKWDEDEEKEILRKTDLNVIWVCFILFTAMNFDRGSLSIALSDNFLDRIGLTTNQYNIGHSINLFFFLISEIPSQLVSKYFGLEAWIPLSMVVFSLISISQAFITNSTTFYITRALLGVFQGGFIAEICLWMSYFYTSKELPIRMAYFYISNPMTQVLSCLLSNGLLKLSSSWFPYGWQWLFIVEGTLTLVVGCLAYFHLTPSAVQTKSWLRPRGWYTSREEDILVNKILRDDPNKGSMSNNQPVTLRELAKALVDYDMAWIYGVRLLVDIGAAPTSSYLQLLLRNMGFSTTATNALTIPSLLMSIVTMMSACWFSEKYNQRGLAIAITPIWVFCGLLPTLLWQGAMVDQWATFGILTILLSYAPCAPIAITWCSSNSGSVRNRTVSVAVVNIVSQIASIIASNMYRQDDAPLYRRGNFQLEIIALVALAWVLATRQWFKWRNQQNERKWNSMTKEEQENYMIFTTDEGNKRLDFRFVY